MAVDARSTGAPSRASEIHRRGLLGTLATLPLVATSRPALAAPPSRPAAWDLGMDAWVRAKFASDTLWAQIKNRQTTPAERAEMDALTERENDAWNLLMGLPSPDVSALSWKLEQTITPDEDGYTGSWEAPVANQILEDARRLSRL